VVLAYHHFEVVVVVLLCMEYESISDSYDGKVKDISVVRSGSHSSTSEVATTESDSDSSVDIQQAQQWVQVKTSCQPHNTKHLRRAQDNSG
jgi:hypothetical protein